MPSAVRSDFAAAGRGGGLYSEAVSQRLGSVIAAAADRSGVTPAILSVANAVIVVAVSAIVAALAGQAASGAIPAWPLGLLALIGWQVGYACDCADGQLARVTGRAGPAGARLDVLCDLAAQIGVVTAIAAVALAYRPGTPAWLPAVFAGTWLVNLLTSVLQSGGAGGSVLPGVTRTRRVVKLSRDYGAVTLLAGFVLALIPQWTVILMWALTVFHGAFLVVSIAAAERADAARS